MRLIMSRFPFLKCPLRVGEGMKQLGLELEKNIKDFIVIVKECW